MRLRYVGWNGTLALLALILLAVPAKGEPNRWEEWRSLNSVGGLFPQIVGLQQLPVVDFLGYPTSSITNPSTGRGRVFYSTTDSLMHCLNSDGSSCFASSGGSGTVTSVSFTGGLISVATPTTTPALTVAGTSGGIPYFSSASTWASSAAGTVNTLMKWGGAGNPPIASSCTDNATTFACTEPITTSANGAASQPALGSTGGTIFTGGTGTTTFPYFYLNNGTAAVTTFNTAGTMVGWNSPSGFTGDQLAIFANNTRVLTVNSGGAITSNSNITAGSASVLNWNSRSKLVSTADGIIAAENNAGTAFTRFCYGGVTSSFPCLQVNGTSLQAELGDGSAQTGFSAKTYSTETNCANGASPAVCGSAASGAVAIPAGLNQTLVVNTSAVTANSRILLTIDESLTISGVTCNTTLSTLTQPVVTARTAGTSFTLQLSGTTATNPPCVSYSVIDQ